MQITTASNSDVQQAMGCLAAAFAQDPITGFLLQAGPNYQGRLWQFLSLLMRARIALDMPVLVARGAGGIHGVAMGYAAVRSPWPSAISEEWNRFEESIPGLPDRMAIYDEIAEKSKPPEPHYYLGVIGMDPKLHGLGHGKRLLESFCRLSADDRLSSGVYLETASPSNVRFYERAGFRETGRGKLGNGTLWCMFLEHGLPNDA